MKTIRIDGRTYTEVEVEEDVMCRGCIFYTVGWDMNTPLCAAANIPEIQCEAVDRENGKNVIFKLMANNVAEE